VRISQRTKGIVILAGSVLFLFVKGLELAFGISGLNEYHPEVGQFQFSFLDYWIEYELAFSTILALGIILSGVMMVLSILAVQSIQDIPTGMKFSVLLGLLAGFGLVMYSYYVLTEIPFRILPVWAEHGTLMDVRAWAREITTGILSISRFDFGLGVAFCCILGGAPLSYYMMLKKPSKVDLGFQLLLILLPLPFIVAFLETIVIQVLVFYAIFGHLAVILVEVSFITLLIFFVYAGVAMMKNSTNEVQKTTSNKDVSEI
jgi:hypothetical protein